MDFEIHLKVESVRTMIRFGTLDACSVCSLYEHCQEENWCSCKFKDIIEKGDKISIILE